MLKSEDIDLLKGQRLSDIMPEILSNKIINKVLTGIGATYSEIMNRFRNSIIVVPNLPVIDGKVKNHKNSENPVHIRSVKNGVRKETIINYLQDVRIPIKKFMTTPESFHIIMEVMDFLGIDVYSEYFLLIDECDKLILDSHYREAISHPMNEFFNFKNKSIISATLVNPSDPRFSRDGFEILNVRPIFDFSENIELLVTNNPVEAFLMKFKQIQTLNDDAPIFVFFNSLQGILRILDKAKIMADYSIFCSSKSKGNLKTDAIHLQNTYTRLDKEVYRKINFLTSRFYAAVDIYVTKPPHVIVISDAVFLHPTMVNPKTDVVQIKGRFRDIELGSLTCISNHTDKNFYYTEQEASNYLMMNKFAYKQIQDMKRLSILDNDKAVLSEILKVIPYSKFMTNGMNENTYMKDNFYYKNKLVQIYSSCNNWIDAFKSHSTGYNYFNIKVKTHHAKSTSGYGTSKYTKKYRDILTIILGQIKSAKASGIRLMEEEQLEEINQEYPEILQGYNLFGEEMLKKVGTSKKRLQKEILIHNQHNGLYNNFDFVEEFRLTFAKDTFYSEPILKAQAIHFIDKYHLEFSKSHYMKLYKKLMILSARTERKIKGIPTKGYYVKQLIF